MVEARLIFASTSEKTPSGLVLHAPSTWKVEHALHVTRERKSIRSNARNAHNHVYFIKRLVEFVHFRITFLIMNAV